jgi:excisionase family DNA binding protein
MYPMNSELSDDKTVGLAECLEEKPRALMVSEVAALLSVSGRQIYKLAAENRIPHLRIAGSIRFDPSALAAWLRQKSSPGATLLEGRRQQNQTEVREFKCEPCSMAVLPKPIFRDAGKPDATVPVTNGCTSAGVAILGDAATSPNQIPTTDGALYPAAEIIWPEIWPAAYNRDVWEAGPDGTYGWRDQCDGFFE